MVDSLVNTLLLALVVIDPLSLAPIFLALTSRLNPQEINRIIRIALITAILILMLFYWFGSIFLETIGVAVPSFRIVGGMFLIVIAFEMVFEKRTTRKINTANQSAKNEMLDSLAVFPLAVPLIAGPAAITLAVVSSESMAVGSLEHSIGFLPLGGVVLLSGISMKAASLVAGVLTPIVIVAVQRIFGLILGALATQFVIDGIIETFGISV